MKSKYSLRRQQQQQHDCSINSNYNSALSCESNSYSSSSSLTKVENCVKMQSVICGTCPVIDVTNNELKISSKQCEICERLQGTVRNYYYYQNNNDNEDENHNENDYYDNGCNDNENKTKVNSNNNNNNNNINKENEKLRENNNVTAVDDEYRRYGIVRNCYKKTSTKTGDFNNDRTIIKKRQLDPLAMDCSRCQSDVGHSLKCASNVVRWRNHDHGSNKFSSKSSSSSPSSSSSFSPFLSPSTSSSSKSSSLFIDNSTIPISPHSTSIIHNYSYLTIFKLSWIFTAIIFTLILSSASAQLHRVNSEVSTIPAKRDVCQSVDVRNSVNLFSRLEGCRVVEGFVQILLIDHANDSSYANLTFPDLVEITGYLLLYRVNGLRSVGHLFPNLTVIRGHSLFINYALVAFEMMHLQEIGLHSLTNIVRGSVRFEKNPALCYVDTIDWDRITGKGSELVISGNKPKNGCPVCEKHCPTRLTKKDETLCWNRQHCQRVCPTCGDNACSDSLPGECCHKNCLGGCTGPTAQDCRVCRDVILDGNRCVSKCPAETYEFLNRRCVQENECRKMKKPREAFEISKDYPYKPFNNSCVTECPAGYMDEEINGKASCKKCEGLCLKECSGASVDSIASAQKLRGCTHITGSLEIQIRGGKNIVKELEDSLSMIEEIDGYLKIVRSFPLISLNFLKNLHTIRGNTLESTKYSLVVLDNQNLQELWDLDSHKSIKILAKNRPVSVFFHFNPKLCLDTIDKFRKSAGLPEFSELEVAPNSNGDKVACNVTKLKAHVTKKTPTAALIEWEAFNHHDPRSLLGYVVYFIEAPNNVTMYDGRDACGGDGWRVDDVSTVDTPGNPVLADANGTEPNNTEPTAFTHILTQLKPYTQYAFYVKTYTIATERSGAQSDLHYFTTSPDSPSIPRNLNAWSNSSNELVIKWEPPTHKNGNLTHYRINGRWEKDDRNFLDQRNYCNEPLLLTEKKFTPTKEDRQKTSDDKVTISTGSKDLTDLCDCSKPDPLARERDVSSSIAFEDALHNQVYVKRLPSERRRRDLTEMVHSSTIWRRDVYSHSEDKDNVSEVMENGFYNVFNRTVYSQTTFSMKNLHHFAVYTIEVQACREPVENDTLNTLCSTKSIKTARTLPLKTADDIPPNSFKYELLKANNSQSTTIKVVWEEPPNPNGLIVTYQIEYKNTNIQNIKVTVVCITRQEFIDRKKMYFLRDLLVAGNYSLRLRATSLAGNGAYTEYQYFYIKELNAGGSHPLLWTILIVLLIVIALGCIGYAVKRKFMPSASNMRLIATVNPEYVSTVYVPDEWEVPRKKIELLRELGNGSFGMVYEGVARDVVRGKPEVKCAVKTVNENATDRERIEFLNEASVMKAFNTHHVVRLLGVVSVGQPTLVVMELMVNGDLKTYLRSHRPDVCENFSKQPPTLKRILQMAIEIADGMSYLAAKKFVHRDLAARNCMVADDMTVKIGDFGMTRDIYETDYYRKGTKGLLPVRWMAPESLKDGVFTSYSDVWSYGIVLWEMVTLASQPYQGLSNDQVLRYVIDGGVMERPENCPDSLYTLMRRTWNHKPNQRPTFIDIATMLLSEVNVESFERVSFYHSPEGIEARNQNASHSPQTDKDLEMASLHNLRDDDAENEGSEESPLRQDFGDFASFEPAGPNSIKISANPIYGATTRMDNSKVSPNFNEFNSSKIPLKADFDDFEGASMESLRSSRDTLDLPFAEDSLKSVKNSPFAEKKNNSSRSQGNVSDNSIVKSQNPSPGSIAKRNFLESPRFSTIKNNEDPDYENRTPHNQVVLNSGEPIIKDTNVLRHVEFPSIDVDLVEDNKNINEKGENKSKVDYKSKPETLNNGFISGKTTQC